MFATGTDGFIEPDSQHGLFVHETRLVLRYQWKVNGEVPESLAHSNVEQPSWLGYYVILPPGTEVTEPDPGSGPVDPGSENTLELRLTRYAGHGLHEDVDLTMGGTNHS